MAGREVLAGVSRLKAVRRWQKFDRRWAGISAWKGKGKLGGKESSAGSRGREIWVIVWEGGCESGVGGGGLRGMAGGGGGDGRSLREGDDLREEEEEPEVEGMAARQSGVGGLRRRQWRRLADGGVTMMAEKNCGWGKEWRRSSRRRRWRLDSFPGLP